MKQTPLHCNESDAHENETRHGNAEIILVITIIPLLLVAQPHCSLESSLLKLSLESVLSRRLSQQLNVRAIVWNILFCPR